MLTERIFTLETKDGRISGNLPEAIALLCRGALIAFEGLAAHQRFGWELFLYQTTALALVRSNETDSVKDPAQWARLADPDAWQKRLAALTPDCADTAWSLLVTDLTRPAFMQPPIAAGHLQGYSETGRTPDEIDVLVTAKDHDVKAARAAAGQSAHWAFALVMLQTQQGYSGRGNFGIARMNGGFASRPFLMLTPQRDVATCFRRGVQAALTARASALAIDDGYYSETGIGLLWPQPWDAETSLSLNVLDPLFVEYCRRIRLVADQSGEIVAYGRPSEVARVDVPKTVKGVLGDAWTPINEKEQAALTISRSGFSYQLLHRLIATNEFIKPAAMTIHAEDNADTLWLHAAGLARGQGKTEGFHERWLPIPARTMRRFLNPEATDAIGRICKEMIDNAKGARQALRFGILAFLQGGPENIDFKDDRPDAWLEALEQGIDTIFFPHLFSRVEAMADAETDDLQVKQWKDALRGLTRDLFRRASDCLSPPQSRRERARAVASLKFEQMLGVARLWTTATGPDPNAPEEDAA